MKNIGNVFQENITKHSGIPSKNLGKIHSRKHIEKQILLDFPETISKTNKNKIIPENSPTITCIKRSGSTFKNK